jgi:hypothetical protein
VAERETSSRAGVELSLRRKTGVTGKAPSTLRSAGALQNYASSKFFDGCATKVNMGRRGSDRPTLNAPT